MVNPGFEDAFATGWTTQGAYPPDALPAGLTHLYGHTILSTTGAPSNSVGSDGDLAYDAAASIIYGPKASGAWPAGVSLKGTKGDTGAAGVDALDYNTLTVGEGICRREDVSNKTAALTSGTIRLSYFTARKTE